MARTTAKQVLDRVDALLPNGYARAEKLRWLAQAEGFVPSAWASRWAASMVLAPNPRGGLLMMRLSRRSSLGLLTTQR